MAHVLFLLLGWLLVVTASCSGPGGSNSAKASCQPFCVSACQTLAECGIEEGSSTCAHDCSRGLDPSTCENVRPLDQYSCDELNQLYRCASYCATLCSRGDECGTFDDALCVQGCAAETPPICNPASVAARTCDQLKPELRSFEDAGRARVNGGATGSVSSGTSAYGLCGTARDCTPPSGCSAETNTCGACTTDAECTQFPGPHACSATGECSKVACVTDANCFLTGCDTARHTCKQCVSNADCRVVLLACDPATFKCVECLSDADCASKNRQCDLATKFCVST